MSWRPVELTEEMWERAIEEAPKRAAHIHRYFVPKGGMSERDIASFVGEFAFRCLIGRDWREGIRPDYSIPDEFDELVGARKVDVKTALHGGRGSVLYNEEQAKRRIDLYDVVVFGVVVSRTYWTPYGWIEADMVTSFPVRRDLPSPAHEIPLGSLRLDWFVPKPADPADEERERLIIEQHGSRDAYLTYLIESTERMLRSVRLTP